MKTSWHLSVAFTLLGVLLAAPVHATLITIDPDAFADGTDISGAFPGVTLTTLSVSPVVIPTNRVFSSTSSLAATGTQVFGHDGIFTTTWARGLLGDLRVDFVQPTDFVSIGIVADDDFDPGFLQAFDAFDVLLDSFQTSGTLGPGVVETATVSTASASIAYVIASGIQPENVGLDNLQYNRIAAVAAPGVLELVTLGLLTLGWRRRRAAARA